MGNIVVNLPDGSGKDLPKDSNGNDLAALIGPGLAKDAVAMSVNGEQRDLSDTLADGDNVSIITIKSDEGLEIMRHTLTAQVLAQAVKNIYPKSKLAIGPTIEDGFYQLLRKLNRRKTFKFTNKKRLVLLIYVVVRIFHHWNILENLSLQRFRELIGKVILKMRCSHEYMELPGEQKRNLIPTLKKCKKLKRLTIES